MKNAKSGLMYLFNVIVGVLTFVFLSQTYIGAGEGRLFVSVANGYDIIGNFFEGNGTEVMMALSNLLVAILAGVLILTSFYCMLVSFGVVKKSKGFKLVNFINVILSLALVVFGAISLFCTVGYVGGDLRQALQYSTGWAVIVNFVIAVLAIVTSILGMKFSKK